MALKSRPGFTLIEAVMTAAAAGVLFLVAGALILQITRFNRQVGAHEKIQRDARVALAGIEREIAQARGHTVVIDRYDVNQPPYSRLTFSGVDDRTVSYYQQGTKLLRRVVKGGVSDTVLVADGLRQVTFSYPMSENSTLVSLSVAFERATYGEASKSFQLSLGRVRIQNPDAF
jgi:Tfp pilus assembly protein FimT